MNKRVLAVGDVNIDIIFSGLPGLPEFDQELLAEGFDVVVGGQTGTIARGLASLGVPVTFVGRVGDDAYGHMAIGQLARDGVDTAGVLCDPSLTTGVTASLSTREERALVTYLGSIAEVRRADVKAELLQAAQHLHVGSFFLQVKLRPDLPGLMADARRLGLTTSLDTGWDQTGEWLPDIFDVLKHVSVFMPNDIEAMAITSTGSPHEALAVLAEYADVVVIKCGEEGCLATNRTESVRLPALPVEVVDTLSAGDIFNAGFLYGYLSGWSLEQTARFANACGAIAVTKVGSSGLITGVDEVEAFLAAHAHNTPLE